MKIILTTDNYYPNVNGAAYFTQRLGKMLKLKGHEVFVFAPNQSFKNSVYKHDGITIYGFASIPVWVYPDFRLPLPSLLLKSTIIKYLKEIKPDVIHLQDHFMIGKATAFATRKLNIPSVGTNHFMPENLIHYFHLPKFIEKEIKKIAWKQFFYVYNKLDAITTPTRTAAELIEKFCGKMKIESISCGINLENFNLKNKDLNLKKKYDIPRKRKILLYVGRLDKEKNIELIINALVLINKKIDTHLLLVGKGKLRIILEKLADKLTIQDHVTFTGFLPDDYLPAVYPNADLFIIAGTAELQSLVTMEAMASGLPILAANAMALPELVNHGKNGYLFENGNYQALADFAIKILTNSNLRKKMSQESLKIIKKHDIERTISDFERIYKKVLKIRQKIIEK